MATFSNARAYYGLTCGGTPSGTNVSGSNSIGVGSQTVTLDTADIAYSFKITSAATGNVARWALDTGIVSQQTGSPVITDGDGKDFEGVALATATTIKAILIKVTAAPNIVAVTFTTSDFLGTPSIEFNAVGQCLWTQPLDCSGGTVDFTFQAAATTVEVIVVAE